jgi:hypothetical protein
MAFNDHFSIYDDDKIGIRNGNIFKNESSIYFFFNKLGFEDTSKIEYLSVLLRLPDGDSIVPEKKSIYYYLNPEAKLGETIDYTEFNLLPNKYKVVKLNGKGLSFYFDFSSPYIKDNNKMNIEIRSKVDNKQFNYDLPVFVRKYCYFTNASH